MRSEQDVNRVLELYSDTVRKICMTYLKSYDDTEDIFQTVFEKYVFSSKIFENAEHEKAWFIRVTINACKDHLKSFFNRNRVSIDEALFPLEVESSQSRQILEVVLSLPVKYKAPIYLYYYEGYSAVEISKIISKKVNTVYTLLSRGKSLLKEKLGDDYIEE